MIQNSISVTFFKIFITELHSDSCKDDWRNSDFYTARSNKAQRYNLDETILYGLEPG